MGCNSCHANERPRLNRVGYEFKRRGYRFSFAERMKLSRNPFYYAGVAYSQPTQFTRQNQSWKGDADFKNADLFSTVSLGRRSQYSFFANIVPITGIEGSTRWLKSANFVATFGDEKNTFQIRGGRLPQFRGSGFMAVDRSPLILPFITSETVEGFQLGKNYGLGGELVYTRDLRTTFRAFAMRVDETLNFRDSDVYGFVVERLFGKGDSSVSATFVHASVPQLTAGQSSISRFVLTGSYEVHSKLLLLSGVSIGGNRDLLGVERRDVGWFGEGDFRLNFAHWPRLTLVTRFDQFNADATGVGTAKRGATFGMLQNVYTRRNFNLRLSGEYQNVFNVGLENRQAIRFGFNVGW